MSPHLKVANSSICLKYILRSPFHNRQKKLKETPKITKITKFPEYSTKYIFFTEIIAIGSNSLKNPKNSSLATLGKKK